MDRRNFLRMGSLAVLGSLAAPSLALPDTVRGALGGTDNKSAVAAAMKHFGVTEADLKKVLTAALEKGGDYADLYFEHSFNNAVALMDGKVNNCSSNIDFGMGVRVLAGDQSGYAYVTPKYIVIGDKTSFYFFNAENGSFLSVMDRKGNGPEEYADIFSRFFDEEKELIYVATPNKTKLYKPDGTFVSEYPKDSISNFIGVSNGYWGTYKREYQKSHLVAFFDKDWNMKQSFFPFDAESVTGFSGGYIVPRFRDGNDQVCIVINDTLYASRKEKLIPAVAINQGKLKMPTDLNGDLERMLTEGKYCIKAENALLVNDLLFYDFFWNESRHYTLWDTNSGELLTHSEKGYAMPYNEKAIVNTPVSLIRNNKAYTLLSADKLAQYGLASEEDDSNPTLLCVDLEN